MDHACMHDPFGVGEGEYWCKSGVDISSATKVLTNQKLWTSLETYGMQINAIPFYILRNETIAPIWRAEQKSFNHNNNITLMFFKLLVVISYSKLIRLLSSHTMKQQMQIK